MRSLTFEGGEFDKPDLEIVQKVPSPSLVNPVHASQLPVRLLAAGGPVRRDYSIADISLRELSPAREILQQTYERHPPHNESNLTRFNIF